MENWPIFGKVLGRKKEGKEGKLEMVCAYDTRASERHYLRNEDTHLIDLENRAFAVLDGLSLPYGGREAAEIALKYIQENLHRIKDGMSVNEALFMLEDILVEASQKIHDSEELKKIKAELEGSAESTEAEPKEKEKGPKKPGSTVVILKIHKDENGQPHALIANVGDSRAYRREGSERLNQITEDQITKLVELHPADRKERMRVLKNISKAKTLDELSEVERKVFFDQSKLSQILGLSSQDVDVNTYSFPLRESEYFLLISDGVCNLTTDEMEKIINKSKTPEEAVSNLLKEATIASRKNKKENFKAHADDMTAVVVEVK